MAWRPAEGVLHLRPWLLVLRLQASAQALTQQTCAAQAVVRPFLQGAHDPFRDLGVQFGPHVMWGQGWSAQTASVICLRSRALERALAGEQFVQRDADREHVGTVVHGAALQELGGS